MTVFVSIFKRSRAGRRDDLIVYFRRCMVVMCERPNGSLRHVVLMESSPSNAIPLFDDGVDVSFCLPSDIPEKDMLYLEHLLPPCYHELRALNIEEPAASGFVQVSTQEELSCLYAYFEDSLKRNVSTFDAEGVGSHHAKQLAFLDEIHDNVVFLKQ